MKRTLTVSLVIISLTSFSQTFSFDKGEGKRSLLSIGAIALELISENKPGDLIHYLSPSYTPDFELLKKECSYVSRNYPLIKGSYAPCFYKKSKNKLSYERTYCFKTEDNIEYKYQIYIQLNIENNEILITNIEFRKGKDIVPHKKEIKKMNNVDEHNPPPPPPPMGLPN